MADEDDGRSDDTMASAPPDDLGARSIMVTITPDGGLDSVGLDGEGHGPAIADRGGPDKYVMLKTLGEGGMGKVYAVLDRDLKRPVALKMIRSSGDPAAQRRFLEEVQVMGQLQHPNILPVHELGLSEGKKLYYTMPLVRGRSLRIVLDELQEGHEATRRAYSLTRLIQVFLQVSQAVGYAHSMGVLHRDLKPANIMLGEHGEVQVIDWGLSKVVAGSQVQTDVEASQTLCGHIMGTPAYMAPEQARGEVADARTDVYALGSILYEVLTGASPFLGTTAEVLQAVVHDTPVRPRERAPGRAIPLDLERACIRALAKAPADRQPSVAALEAEVQAWLEVEADKAKRHERAEARAVEGHAHLEDYRGLKKELLVLQAEVKAARERFEPWRSVEEKRPLLDAEERVAAARSRLTRSASRAVATLTEALAFEREHVGARGALADYYWDRFLEAEAKRDAEARDFFGELVAEYHDGKYARELRGDGSLELRSDPAGAEVWLHELCEEGLVLVERNPRLLGLTPLPPLPLAMGSYLVILRKAGYRDTRYPVHIGRNGAWNGEVRLYTDEQVGAGFIHVPAGRFVLGGDEDSWTAIPRAQPWVEDFFIGEHPVTTGEYLEFLNDVARRHGTEAAKARSPRYKSDQPGSSYLLEDGQGGLTLPEVDAEGDRWDARIPVVFITWHDAVEYCAWRSERDRREYRLVNEVEWEKAARGVDERWYPWGWKFDASLCNMRESRKERNAPATIDEYPRDVSVYGVRGLGGNVRDWTATEEIQGHGPTGRLLRIARGGNWDGTPRISRAANRNPYEPTYVGGDVGFRLIRSRRDPGPRRGGAATSETRVS